MYLGRTLASTEPNGGGWNNGFGLVRNASKNTHEDGSDNHLRFGEVAGAMNMNYAADATFANVQSGADRADTFFVGAGSPGAQGRYHKGTGATYTSPGLPAGFRPLRATWTEIPADLWFDEDGDGWAGDPAYGHASRNDRDGNGKRDVRIVLEIWDSLGRQAVFDDPAAANPVPPLVGPSFYRAVFVNEWDPATRANLPLDATAFLDDVTLLGVSGDGPEILAWEEGG